MYWIDTTELKNMKQGEIQAVADMFGFPLFSLEALDNVDVDDMCYKTGIVWLSWDEWSDLQRAKSTEQLKKILFDDRFTILSPEGISLSKYLPFLSSEE